MAKTIEEMAEELGINKDNLKKGLKKDESKVSDAVKKAYKFKFGRRSK